MEGNSSPSQQPSQSSPATASVKPKPSLSLSIYLSNCRSLLPKVDELRFLSCLPDSPSIIASCKTWLDPTIVDCEVSLPNYCVLRRDRDRHGGRVALYVHHSIMIGKVSRSTSCELLSVEIQGKSSLVLLAVVYRPPNSPCDLTDLGKAFGSCQLSKYNKVLLIGDFNIDQSSTHSPAFTNFQSLLSGFSLFQLVDEPTRVTEHSSSVLDLFLTNCPDLVTSLDVVDPLASSDHSSISATLSIGRSRHHLFKRQVWLYQHTDLDALNVALEDSLPPPTVLAGGDVDSTWPLFREAFMSTIQRFIPSKVITFRSLLPPWLTKDVRRHIRNRNKARTAAKRLDTAASWSNFRRL